jgi:hypothetical protein
LEKKTDHSTGKTYDLDKTYKNIIKPSVIAANGDMLNLVDI